MGLINFENSYAVAPCAITIYNDQFSICILTKQPLNTFHLLLANAEK